MGKHRERKRGVGQWVAVLLVGMLAGSVMLTPVGAHIKNFNHLKTKHFYTKKAADARFVNVGEKASDADKLDGKDSTEFLGSTAKAADADKVDGLDSTQLSVFGWARVLGELVSLNTGEFGTSVATCPAGTKILGGGHVTIDGVHNIEVFRSWPDSDTTWNATGEHVAGGNDRRFRAYAVCGVASP
jgi:hypothetical protein